MRKQGEPEAGQRAQHHGGSHAAGSEARVRVDHVRLQALEADNRPGAEDGRSDVRHDPVHACLRGPAVPEEADGYEGGADEEQGNAELGAADVAVGTLEAPVDAVVDGGGDLHAEEEADAHGDVVEGAEAGGLAVDVGEEGGEGGEHEVHEAVDEAAGVSKWLRTGRGRTPCTQL